MPRRIAGRRTKCTAHFAQSAEGLEPEKKEGEANRRTRKAQRGEGRAKRVGSTAPEGRKSMAPAYAGGYGAASMAQRAWSQREGTREGGRMTLET